MFQGHPGYSNQEDAFLPVNPIEEQIQKRHTEYINFKPGQEDKINSFWY